MRAIGKTIQRIKMNIYPLFKLGGPPKASIMPFSSCDMGSKIRLV